MSAKGKLILFSGLGLIVALGGLYFAIQVWMPFMWFLLIPALLCLALWIFLDRKVLIDFFQMKTTRQGLSMGAILFMVLFLLCIVNFLAARYTKTFDFSTAQVYTLSEQTQTLLKNLDSDVKTYFFYKQGLEGSEAAKKSFAQLMKTVKDFSSKVQFDYVEMNSRPKLVQEFSAKQGSGESFLEYKGQKIRIESAAAGAGAVVYSEQDFANALIKATRTTFKKIYFLQGHGERDSDNEKNEMGVSSLKQMLAKNSYTTETWNIVEKGAFPQDADVVASLGPQVQFQKIELDLLKEYLSQGGSLFLALDDKKTAGLEGLLQQIGVTPQPQIIYNILNTPSGPVVNAEQPTVAAQFSSTHPATRQMGQNTPIVLLYPQSLQLKETSEKDDIQVAALLMSPQASVALENQQSKDYIGQPRSFVLAAAAEGSLNKDKNKANKKFSMMVFGDVDFLSNQFIYQNSNKDFALNIMSSLAKETDLISISSKNPQATKMIMTVPEFNQYYKFIVVGLFLPIPFIFLVISGVMWFRRRHA